MNMHLLTIALTLSALPVLADPPIIESVSAHQTGETWRFDVTLSHPDTGWDHYADGWRVLDMQGNELALRVLAHPHVQEQPFTRSLSGVSLPAGSSQVQIQARCSLDGWGDQRLSVDLE